MLRTLRPILAAAALAVLLTGCGKSNENPGATGTAAADEAAAAAARAGEAAAKAGESAAKAGEAAAIKAGEAAAKAGEAAAKAGEAAALAAGGAAAKAGEAAAKAGEAASVAGAAAAEAAGGAAAEAGAAAAGAEPADWSTVLADPSKATATAPASFDVRFDTTKGAFTLHVTRDWAPKGADRLYNLVKAGFLKDIAFFRAIEGFMVQFGIHGDPKIAGAWRSAEFGDDPVKQSNRRGTLSFGAAVVNRAERFARDSAQ